MIELIKLEQSDFETFKSWIDEKDDLFQFAGPMFNFPVTNAQLERYITDERRIVFKVVLADTKRMIGNAELNFENTLPRLSRILIGDLDNRNKGIGIHIVNKLLEKLFVNREFEKADLNVFDWNKAAIRCYKKVGFVVNPDLVYHHNNDGINWTALNMTITKSVWNSVNHKREA